ncbi:hypothetical protein RFI_37756 [Reticulomyxa filosa]|uniref:Uncharacterized protein n=1 Tax=Reticulomyxa filosa TaxID=46433 RepID=X6LF02_RETFI|nr:hypothetical protein RFI_37756 [Reticulomyxa filosa]|eukprot:ETN99711.1 hypothetical protein RFI_37756 [Reticulomyxa filosa]
MQSVIAHSDSHERVLREGQVVVKEGEECGAAMGDYIFEENDEEQISQDQENSDVKASELSTHHKGFVDLSKAAQLLVLSKNQDDDSDKDGNALIRKLSKKEQQHWQPISPVKMQDEPLVKKS